MHCCKQKALGYSYVHNDSINNTDPTGHWAQGAPVHAFSIGQGSNLNSSDWQRVHRELIRLGYRGSNNAPLQVAGSPNQHTEHAIRRFRTRNNIAPVTGRIMRGDRTHSRLLSSAARGEAIAVPAPQIRAVVSTRRAPNQAEWRRVQTRLNELGYRGVDNRPVPVSGRLDHHTSSALTRFRVRNSISPTSQPLIVDDVTWNRLMNARTPVREVVRSTTPVVSTARPVQTTPGKTNPTANLRDSDVARKITGDKYEPPTYIRVLGFRIRIPASIANVFLNRSGGSTARASGASEALEADEGYIGIEATSVIVIVGGGILLGGLFISAAAVSAIITIAVIVLAVIAIALLIELVVVPIVNALRMSIAESIALRMELQSRSLSSAMTGERVMDLPGTGNPGLGNPGNLGNILGGLSITFVMTEAMFRARTDQVELTAVRGRLKPGRFYPAMAVSRFLPLMVIPVPIKNDALAKRTMLTLGTVPGGVYTVNKVNAKRIVQSVSPGGKAVVHEPGHGIGHFPHYHPYNRIPKTHAWYGVPRLF